MTIVLIAAVLYLVATGLLLVGVRRPSTLDPDRSARTWLLPAIVAVVLHGAAHVLAWRAAAGPDLHFFAALSLVGIGMAALTTLYGATGRMAALGVIVLPLAATSLLAYAHYGHVGAAQLDWRLQLHAWCALLAYATLAVAALLAIMLLLQERAMRRRHPSARAALTIGHGSRYQNINGTKPIRC